MKKWIILPIILFLLLCSFIPRTQSVIVDPGTYFEVGNENYTVGHQMNFSQILVNATWITFNTTGFNVTAPNNISIILYYIDDNPITEENYTLNFSADTTAGTVWFNLSGFNTNSNYTIYRNGTFLTTSIANATGVIHFSNNVWSERNFSILNTSISTTIPTVQTLSATGMEETNVTFWGTLIDNGGDNCTAWFEYGINLSYGNETPLSGWDLNAVNSEPRDITTDGNYIYVEDSIDDEVYNYTMDGVYTGNHWDTGSSDAPYGLTTTGNYILVYDHTDDEVYNYTIEGVYTTNHWDTGDVGCGESKGMTTNGTHVWLDDSGDDVVYVFYTDGTYITNWDVDADGLNNAAGMTTDGNFIYIADWNDQEVYNYTMDGVYTGNHWDTGYTGNTNPRGMATDGTYIYIADGVDQAIYRYTMDGVNVTRIFPVTSGETFTAGLPNLVVGQLYHYRAVANNSNGTAYGADEIFLTKPNAVASGLANTTNVTDINLLWIAGEGANNTYIERNTVASWSRGAGTLVYNGTGTTYLDDSTNESPLSQNTTYYYRLWSYTEWTYNPTLHQWSDTSILLSNTTSIVNPPYNATVYYEHPTLRIVSWNRSNNSDQDLVICRNDTWATSWNQSGNWLRQNNTNTSFNVTESIFRYYTIFSYNATDIVYSSTGLNIIWAAVSVGCFNESNMSEFITFDLEITNADATQSYVVEDVTTWLNLNVSLIPYGDNTIFIFSSDGYRQRTYYYDLEFNHMYNISAYLPLIEVPGGDDPDPDCILRGFSDTVAITNPNADATITLTYVLDSIISVEIYNESLYGTYGGWIEIASSNYSYSTTQVIVNQSVLDVNTTMAKATYYYEDCEELSSILCTITVLDELGQPVSNATCTVKRINNLTTPPTYVTVSIEITDGAGQFTIWLIPYVTYRFEITLIGYEQIGSRYWIPSPEERTKEFRLDYIETEPTPPDVEPEEITFEGYINGTILYINYTDALNQTINTTIYVYEKNFTAGTTTLLTTNTTTGNSDFQFNTTINNSNEYIVILHYNHSTFGYQRHTLVFEATYTPLTTQAISDALFALIYGSNPFGWTNIFMLLFVIGGFFAFGQRGSGISLILVGGLLLFIHTMIGFNTVLVAAAGGIIPTLLIIVGIMVLWRNYRKEEAAT